MCNIKGTDVYLHPYLHILVSSQHELRSCIAMGHSPRWSTCTGSKALKLTVWMHSTKPGSREKIDCVVRAKQSHVVDPDAPNTPPLASTDVLSSVCLVDLGTLMKDQEGRQNKHVPLLDCSWFAQIEIYHNISSLGVEKCTCTATRELQVRSDPLHPHECLLQDEFVS